MGSERDFDLSKITGREPPLRTHDEEIAATARREAMEEAARIADHERDKWLAYDTPSNPDRRQAERAQYRAYEADELADAIRAAAQREEA